MSLHSSFMPLGLPTLAQPGSLALPATRRWVAAEAGWVTVQAGRAWLTRDGDLDDHVLTTGQRLWLARGDRLTAESWEPGEPVWLVWRPEPQAFGRPLLGGLVAALAGGLARGARGLAGGLLALARSAEASARRAQGSICAGDSMASAGALQ
jgi:Protein of unknown function (DUF2917)